MKIAEGKTLVILSPGFPASESDTTCLPTIQDLVLGIREKFPALSLTVIAFHYPFHASRYTWNGIGVIALGGANKPRLHRLATWWRAWRALKQLNKRGIYGLLSLWYGECSLVGKFFARRYGIKHFCWLQGQDVKEGNKYVSLARLPAAGLIAMSHFLAGEMERNYGICPKYVIPNGIREMPPAAAGDTTIDVLGVGSLIPLKRWHLFIEAVREARTYYPGIRAVIVGSGIEHDRLRKRMESAGLSDCISLLGEQNNSEVLQLMQRSRVLLHPSGYEGFGRVCIEALAAGAEVISFCRPLKEPVEGWHIVNTINEMHTVLRERLQAPQIRHPMVPFDMHQTAEKIVGLYGNF